ncbi:site-specific integrase [Lentilactobacillus kosonis]|uniref:Phage integrase n=1 Tax=Lentilactobacillus kosonis TaxID=2810561 RepID=A0A401FHW3_9LACO|nr:site-specific integrase [Lentilactobacillus kosonis]GAY71965.1 phage integrase [Lentilactobacillus kosonis]
MSRIYLNPMKGKRYKAEFSIGSGKQRKRKTHTFDDKETAKKWINQLSMEADQGTNFERSDWLFVDYYWHWVETYKQPVVSSATLLSYVTSYRHFQQHLGEVRIGRLTRARIQRFLNELGLSHETARKDLMHLRSCMKDAMLDGTIARNPAEGRLHIVADPKLTKSDDKKFMTIDEYKHIRDFLLNFPHSLQHINWMTLMIISQTALRVGECIALKYDDFDFEHNTVRIDESWDSVENEIKEPKTKYSKRTIPVPAKAMSVIHRWIAYHRQVLFRLGITNPDQFLLLNQYGKLPISRNINSSYHQLQKKLGYKPKFSTHTFRHTIASLMLGDSKVSINYVSKYLGHASVAITQKYYIGLLPEQREIEEAKAVRVLGS